MIGFPLSSGGSIREYLCCIASGLLQYVCIQPRRHVQEPDADRPHPSGSYSRPQFIIAGEIADEPPFTRVSPLERAALDISPDLYGQLSLYGQSCEEKKESRDGPKRHRCSRRGRWCHDRSTRLRNRAPKKQNGSPSSCSKIFLSSTRSTASAQAQDFREPPLAFLHPLRRYVLDSRTQWKVETDRGLDNPPSGTYTIDDGERSSIT